MTSTKAAAVPISWYTKDSATSTTSLYAGMLCVNDGMDPGSKYSLVSASVDDLNSMPCPGRTFSIHFNDWKKKARR